MPQCPREGRRRGEETGERSGEGGGGARDGGKDDATFTFLFFHFSLLLFRNIINLYIFSSLGW